MTRKELIEHLSQESGISKRDVTAIVLGLSAVAMQQLRNHGEFTLPEIGTLAVVETAARKGRNPQTGEAIDIPAGKRIKLKAAKALKDAVAI